MTYTTANAEIKANENGFYGIVIRDGRGKLTEYREVTRDLDALEAFAKLINEGKVSEVHYEEILEDIIG